MWLEVEFTHGGLAMLGLLLLGLQPTKLVLGLGFAVRLDSVGPIDCVRHRFDLCGHVGERVLSMWTSLVSVMSDGRPADNVYGEQSWLR